MNGTIRKVLFNRGFLTLFICYSLACTCFAFVNVGLLLHTTEDFGMDAVIVGSVIGAVSLIGLCMRPISAVVVDRVNRKHVLVFAFALEALSTFGFAYADQYYLLYLLQIMRGIAWGLISCAGVVLIVDIVGREDRVLRGRRRHRRSLHAGHRSGSGRLLPRERVPFRAVLRHSAGRHRAGQQQVLIVPT